MTLFVRRRRSQVKFIGKKILFYLVYKINLFIFTADKVIDYFFLYVVYFINHFTKEGIMKPINYLPLVLIVSLLWGWSLNAKAEKNLTVLVTNIPSQTGNILITVGQGQFYDMAEVKDAQVEIVLKDIPNGEYQLSAFHDANANWQLDMEEGLPLEYCVTRKITVSDETRYIKVALVNVKEEVLKKREK